MLQQWVQLHRLTPLDILTVVATLRGSFRYVSFYAIGGQGVLVATNDPARAHPRLSGAVALEQSASLKAVRGMLGRPLRTLVGDRLLDSDGVDRYVHAWGAEPSTWLSTDDNVALEYSTPRANANPANSSMALNLEVLSRFRVAAPAAAVSSATATP